MDLHLLVKLFPRRGAKAQKCGRVKENRPAKKMRPKNLGHVVVKLGLSLCHSMGSKQICQFCRELEPWKYVADHVEGFVQKTSDSP